KSKLVYQDCRSGLDMPWKYRVISVYKMESMQLLREVLSDTYKLKNELFS
ncbi:hypothetical protein GMD4S_09805, partial [Streptococcus sp. GMD4S]